MNQLADADYCTRVVDDLAAIGEAKWNALVAASGMQQLIRAVRVSACTALERMRGAAFRVGDAVPDTMAR